MIGETESIPTLAGGPDLLQSDGILMRLPRRRAVQIAIGFVLSVALFGVLLIWMPYQREMWIASKIKASVGTVGIQFGCFGPAWIPRRFQERLVIFNRISGLELTECSQVSMIISDVKALSNVKLIRFYGSDITDRELGHLMGLNTLRILDLRKTAITDVGLAQIGKMTDLERLYIGRTQITDQGLKSVGELVRLDLFDLDQIQVSDEGLPHLRGLTRLRQLGVGNSNVTDNGLEFLHSLPNFDFLDVERTQVTAEARERLRKTFPKCAIFPNP
ncbi:MAG: hypothetical protein JWP89_3510 [Schlesneria sp.]|nr:hypothetical protein [Schlesneria sp.]